MKATNRQSGGRRLLRLAGTIALVTAVSGIPRLSTSTERDPAQDARRLSEGYRALLTPTQERSFLAERSVEGRIRYAESLGLRNRYEKLPDEHKAAILDQELVRGMGRDALLLSWGEPYQRYYLRDGVEEWIYKAEWTPHLSTGEIWSLHIEDNQLTEYSYDLLDAPEAPNLD